jgi:group I intron endonuclease
MLYALGFVFLFTIGGLINLLALPLKTTICEKLLIIMILWYFLILEIKDHNFEQFAGNLLILCNNIVGTPETSSSPRVVAYTTSREDIVRVIKYLFIYLYIYNLNSTNFRSYSNLVSAKEDKNNNLNLVKIYNNLKEDRIQILKDQKDKSGVYCLVNNINGHKYVGSSINLSSRMKNYLNNTYLKNKNNSNMPIVKALLKYDQFNFSVWILEYVEPEFLSIRETFYIIFLMPYYNVLKQGYSSLGYKQTEETKKLLSKLAKNRTHSEKTKVLISRALVGENNPFYNKNHSTETKIRIIEAKSAYPVYIYNSFKKLLAIFPSVGTLAKLIKSNHKTLVNVIKEEILFRGEWYLLNIPYNIEDSPSISSWYSKEGKKLVLEINNQSHIKKAIFVYDVNKNFIGKYEGVTDAQRTFNISHSTIKKYALVGGTYNRYIFSYERLPSSKMMVE